ncbi:MAG: YHS domain-containing protein [Pirellulaceae bacterium]|nr:YHS domain-containing protein [Pirellulaceae bacterium]
MSLGSWIMEPYGNDSMNNIDDFAKLVELKLESARLEPHWKTSEADGHMLAIAERRLRFESMASSLIKSVIQPRLETIASYFSNACLSHDSPVGQCSCWFGYCERFPASTNVSLAVEHDTCIEHVSICFDVYMTPMFIKLREHDRLTLLLDAVQDKLVAEWLEDCLIGFISDYLLIDRGGDEFEEDIATDPVCGMRISRSEAVDKDTYYGHPYFFCSNECKKRFADEPTKYVVVRTLY